MTYGWAILIIAVVLGALFQLGVFNANNFAPKAPPGSCQVFRPNGPYTTSFINLEGVCSGELPQYAASFSASGNSYIQSVSFPLPSWTVVAWADASTVPSGRAGIAGEGWYWDDKYVEAGWGRWAGNCCNITTDACPYLYGSSITPDQWVFLATTFSAPSNTMAFYQNGVLQGTNTAAGCSIDSNNEPVRIGADDGNDEFPGEIANVQIYNTSLSASQIQQLYQEGIGGAPIDLQHLVGWWPLNGNANDYSGNGNNGTQYNVWYSPINGTYSAPGLSSIIGVEDEWESIGMTN